MESRELLRDMGREDAKEGVAEREPHRPARGSEGKERRSCPALSGCASGRRFSGTAAGSRQHSHSAARQKDAVS